MNYFKTVRDNLETSTAVVSLFLPAVTYIEKHYADMSDSVYFGSRLWNSGTTFLGVPIILWGKDKFRKLLNIDKDAIAPMHDAIYGGVVGTGIKTAGYFIAGEHDLEKIVHAVAASTVFACAVAPAAFYLVDVFKDMTGQQPITESRKRDPEDTHITIKGRKFKRYLKPQLERFEDWLTSTPLETKNKIAYGCVAACLASAVFIWYLAPNHTF